MRRCEQSKDTRAECRRQAESCTQGMSHQSCGVATPRSRRVRKRRSLPSRVVVHNGLLKCDTWARR